MWNFCLGSVDQLSNGTTTGNLTRYELKKKNYFSLMWTADVQT